jgi:hypothetical protein
MKPRRRGIWQVFVAVGLASCASISARDSEVQAAALRQALEKGCLPYALGEKPETVAMADAGIRRMAPRLSFPSPSVAARQYSSGLGNPIVTVYGQGCTVRARGADAAPFEVALDQMYRERFGPNYAAHVPSPQPTDSEFQGLRRFCAAGRSFVSYPDRAQDAGELGFNVAIVPSSDPACDGGS